jgi:hypothetical protein
MGLKSFLSFAGKIAMAFGKSVMGGFTPIQNLMSGMEDYDWYIQTSLNDLTPQYFSDVMIGLRVREESLDYQLMGLSMVLGDYMEIGEGEVVGALSSSESIDAQIEDIIFNMVEDYLAGIDDYEAVCKNFWNGRELF